MAFDRPHQMADVGAEAPRQTRYVAYREPLLQVAPPRDGGRGQYGVAPIQDKQAVRVRPLDRPQDVEVEIGPIVYAYQR